jgi:beta-glucosidase
VEEAGTWSLIAAGNNPDPINEILKREWGFRGFVVNDPTPDQEDDKVRRILRATFGLGIVDRKPDQAAPAPDTSYIKAAAQQSVVLLKNSGGLLPLEVTKVKSIAVIGPLEGIRERAGTLIEAHIDPGTNPQAAAGLAQKCDAAIVGVGSDATVLRAVAAANPKTIAVLTRGPVDDSTGWMESVPAALMAWMPGGIADIVFGDFNPSGKLPFTYAKTGERAKSEGIYAGYRYADQHNLGPLLPFGHGLS